MMTNGHNAMGQGYIYVKNWEKFQHPDAVRSTHMPWLKLHTELLGHDEWLELRPADRVLHIGILMLTSRYGNGRIKADSKWLCAQLKLDWSGRYRGLERLNQAGFISVRASKAASRVARKVARTEGEGSKEPKKKSEIAHASSAATTAARARSNGDQPDAVDQARRLRSIRTNYQGVLLENGPSDAEEWLRENHPDLADQILGRTPAQKETA